MYCPEKQKYNRFEVVDIPSNRDLFFRLGRRMPEANMFSGEEELPQTMSKTDALAAAARQAEQEYFESDKDE